VAEWRRELKIWAEMARPVLVGVAYLTAWVALDFAAKTFQTAPGVSVWAPQASLDLVLLLVFGLRWWPLTLLNIPLHVLIVGDRVTFGLFDLLLFDVATTATYLGAAAFLLRRIRIDPGLSRLRDVAWFVGVAALAAPLVVAMLQVLTLSLFGHLPWADAPLSVLQQWAGDATGIGMLTPFLLVTLRRWPGLWNHPPGPARDEGGWPEGLGWLKIAAEAVALGAGVWMAYGTDRVAALDYTYLVWLPMTWVALRYGFARVTLVILLLNVAIALMTKAQMGAVASLALQFGLMGLTLTGLLLGAVSTENRYGAERLRHDALHDALTGLPNRALFTDRLEQALRRALRDRRAFAVLFLDLDRFKGVNDGLGHLAGDRLLVEVGRRLAGRLRPGDTVARFGGDEFALLVEGGVADVLRVADRLLTAFDQPFDLDGREVRAAASIGIAPSSGDEGVRKPEHLLRDADAALHQAKAQGGGRYVLFDQAMHARALERLELEADLRRALADGELELHFQPIVGLEQGAVVAAEALARWRHPERGLIPPGAFVPMAEETGLIHPLGRWALRAACAQAKAWREDGRPLRVAVNVSTREMQQPDFAEQVLRTLTEVGVGADALVLELTEGVLLVRTAQVTSTLDRLAAAGVRLVIDDFGTGYASLGYLKHLPVHGLKIDRTFVRDVPGDAGSEAIVEAVLALATRMELSVTAEGVETTDQAAFLRQRGCRSAQGFLFGRPTPADDLPGNAVPDWGSA
jgi:diguanylate cyclase (GGDEF)-like protein